MFFTVFTTRVIAASVFFSYTRRLQNRACDKSGTRLPACASSLWYGIPVARSHLQTILVGNDTISAAHFFIISLTFGWCRDTRHAAAFRRRHATPLHTFRNFREARDSSLPNLTYLYPRDNENDFLNTKDNRLMIITIGWQLDTNLAARNRNCAHRWREGLSRAKAVNVNLTNRTSLISGVSKGTNLQNRRGCWSRLILAVVTNLLNLHGNLQFSDFLECMSLLYRSYVKLETQGLTCNLAQVKRLLASLFHVYENYGKCELYLDFTLQ